jgi:chromosome segregation ATPase
VRPLSDEDALQQVDLVPYEELREEFRSGLTGLKNVIFSRPKPKNINGKALTGPMFAALCQAYVDAINSGGVPTISSAWEDVTAKENASAAEAALAEYRRVFGEQVPSLPVESAAINAGDKIASEVALNMYSRRAVGESAKQGRKELTEKIEAIFAERWEANMRESQAQCSQLVQQLYAQKVDPLASNLDADETSYQQAVTSMRSAWTEAVKQYEEQAVGPAKYSELAAFCNRQLLNLLQIVTAAMQQNFDTRMNEVRTEMLRAQQEAAQLKANAEVLENSLAAKDAKLESLTSKVSAMSAEAANLQERVAELTKQKREAERRAEEQEDNATQLRGKLEDRELEIKVCS